MENYPTNICKQRSNNHCQKKYYCQKKNHCHRTIDKKKNPKDDEIIPFLKHS